MMKKQVDRRLAEVFAAIRSRADQTTPVCPPSGDLSPAGRPFGAGLLQGADRGEPQRQRFEHPKINPENQQAFGIMILTQHSKNFFHASVSFLFDATGTPFPLDRCGYSKSMNCKCAYFLDGGQVALVRMASGRHTLRKEKWIQPRRVQL